MAKQHGIRFKVEIVPTLGGSPARCQIIQPNKSAVIYLAQDQMSSYPPSTKAFIVLHEKGHAVLNSGNEINVDRWAFKQFIKTKHSLKGAVYAVSKVLHPTRNEEHSERVIRQYQRAKMVSLLRGKITLKEFKKLSV